MALGEPDTAATEIPVVTTMIHLNIMGASIKVSNMHLAKIIQIMAPIQKGRQPTEEAEEEDEENKTDI